MRAYVGVTDADWYSFLAARPHITEVNFWQPSGGRSFRILETGEPFFFKTHHPHNRVVGGGFFSGFAVLPLSDAWNLLGEANGAGDITTMRQRISQYRSTAIAPDEDPLIGSIFVRDVMFYPPGLEMESPPGLARNVVQGKSYPLAEEPAASYFDEALRRLLGHDLDGDLELAWRLPGPVFGDPRLAPRRLGQQAFQAVVAGAYHRRCAITGDRIRPVLQAAHIRPVSSGGEHRLDNGLLLRSDAHTLFDAGYLGVDLKHRLLVSPRLRSEFGNGEQFYARSGRHIELPDRRVDRPGREYLEWHLDEKFLAS
ncbi:MAG TPA: HNH endonuclease [Mycobacteriales bacterium]|nr:HNH endonuclease [Mycobacteriales bacterium]